MVLTERRRRAELEPRSTTSGSCSSTGSWSTPCGPGPSSPSWPAVIGWFMVLRRQSFAGHTIAVVGFPGAAGATLIGVSALYGYFAFCVAAALLISAVPHSRGRALQPGERRDRDGADVSRSAWASSS